MHEYLPNFVVARDAKTSAALGELTLIPSYRTDQFCLSFLPATVIL